MSQTPPLDDKRAAANSAANDVAASACVPAKSSRLSLCRSWWPLLFWPIGIALIPLAHRQGWSWLLNKGYYETVGLALIGLAAGLFLGRARACGRGEHADPLRLILGCFAFALLAREIHFPGTGDGVYVAMLACAIWAWLWRRRLAPLWVRKPVSGYFLAALATYALSQLVAQRFMRFLPYEGQPHDLHIYYEEISEVIAHLILVLSALV